MQPNAVGTSNNMHPHYHHQQLPPLQHCYPHPIHVSIDSQAQPLTSSRFPVSPPSTGMSGSSESPTSTSTLSSPVKYDNQRDHNDNNNGFNHGVNEPNSRIYPMPQPGFHENGGHPSQMAMYAPYHPSQMSPPAMMNYGQYPQPMKFDYENYENMHEGPFSGERTSLKRKQPSHFYDVSRVKPDPTMPAYPQPPAFVPPPTPGPLESPFGSDSFIDEPHKGDAPNRVIGFAPYREEHLHKLYDANHKELHLEMRVVADKGFIYSKEDACFVNQKKNHFQVSVNIEVVDGNSPVFVRVGAEFKPIVKMLLPLCGIKAEMHSSEIQIKQSHKTRVPEDHVPYELDAIHPREVNKTTVPRLHFSKTTENNHRQNGKPNKDQKYFLLLVRLVAITADGGFHTVLAFVSDRIIVRATNPGQFNPPPQEIAWENGDGRMFINHPVSIGTTENYGGMLNVNGNIMLTGLIEKPSDRRLKENIRTIDGKEAMRRQSRIRVVEYSYKKEVASKLGMSEEERHRTGIIAQELAEIHPESVNTKGDFLTVDESRMFYDNIAAVQELSDMHEVLEEKIEGRFAHMQAFFGKIFRRKPADGISVISNDSGLAGSLSASRYSLASTFKREIAEHNKNTECRKHDCSRSDSSAPCSSRLTQGTIITLVVVMAVCLLSMSALYILDWHNRNYGIHARIDPPKPGDEAIGLMKKTINMPRHQPGAPPLHDMCLHSGCRSYCCDNKVSYATEKRQGGFDPQTIKPLTGSKKAFLAAIAGAEKMNPTAFFPKPLLTGSRFEVVGMNMTIDSRYCTERSCNEKKGRYHLFVPVSPYMPTTPVMLRITPPNGMFVQSCGHMIDFREEECPSEGGSMHFTLNMPTALEVESNLFEISAGSYKRSGYRFRVGTNTESCFGSQELFKSSYEEYNIIFYRTCGDDIDQAPTMIEIETERDFGIVHGTKRGYRLNETSV